MDAVGDPCRWAADEPWATTERAKQPTVFPGKDGPLDVGVAQRKSERPTHPGPPPCSSGVSLVYPPRLHPNRKMRTTHV